ncbi:transglycosylase SLT domain-containing protein [Paraburkholderia sp. SARCC-3016]|uniref:transglycosylase SLT domain-containing protein n=1 Tax=Paraburkholderia sp. SARCC-3016 TaxID=3058611 RepID=UPI0028087894|nr:transglycosylase SLT domain-containing protein [Paraburkholderia sp. SARCC-3016]MDQ7975939.1 transglycosylase SLT domain-containing protein [Paraburkholderia sp. SARCC-3016]
MNAWLTWRPDERAAQAVRAVLRRGTRLSHHLFSVVGGIAVVLALALWLMPTWRGTLAAKLMPVLSKAVEAGPVRLLQGNPLPSFAPPGARKPSSDDTLSSNNGGSESQAVALTGVNGFDNPLDLGMGLNNSANSGSAASSSALNGLDPRTLPSVASIADMIPAQRVSADARDDRVLVSSREQDLVATFLARRYRVAQEPVSELVKAAFDTGHEVGLDPLLLLAVMAIESGFNPYAESGVGAKGLMQVMSTVHSDKFRYFGGQSAALEPLANIKVGALVLKDCIARGGSLPGGLRLYVGSSTQDDGGYGAKVMAERSRLRDVARGRKVPINAPQAPATVTASTSSSQQAANSSTGKRVQVTLDGGHAIAAAKSTSATSAVPAQDDASTSQKQHVATSEQLGA